MQEEKPLDRRWHVDEWMRAFVRACDECPGVSSRNYVMREPLNAEYARIALLQAACGVMTKVHAATVAELRLGTKVRTIGCELWMHSPRIVGPWPSRSGKIDWDHWHVALLLPGRKTRRWVGSAEEYKPFEEACALALGWSFRLEWNLP